MYPLYISPPELDTLGFVFLELNMAEENLRASLLGQTLSFCSNVFFFSPIALLGLVFCLFVFLGVQNSLPFECTHSYLRIQEHFLGLYFPVFILVSFLGVP